LGSTRMVTGETGTVAAGYDYLPFGEVVRESGGMAGQTVRFTGKERDEGTGLDNFLARYYSAPVGRFTSPDAPFADQGAEDPQSWNLFAYGRNNPLRFTDPTGRTVCDVNGNHCRDEITVTDTMEKIAVYMFVTTAKVVQSTQEMVQPVADWMNRPRNPICTAGYMGLGASIGFWAGGGLGTLGLAGGPAAAATIPGGAAGGAALGGAIGGFGGLVLCSTGSGGGSSSGSSGSSQDKKLSSSEVKKLEQSSGESAHQIKTEVLGTNKNISQYDLYKDTQGNVLVKGKGGVGEAIPTGLKVN
ncbi:MAG: RHS repeat-associated core domain-containing protein, partial [bacterium]